MKFSKFIVYVLAIIGGFCCLTYIVETIRHEPPLDYNPHHAVNGIDTVYSDSIYTIEVKIKNVKEYEEEPPTDYR